MNNREKFKEAIVKIFDNSKFTTDDAKAVCEKIGFTESQYKTIYTHVMRHVKVAKGIYAFPADHHFGTGQKTVKASPAVVKAEKQKTLQSDLDIINEPNKLMSVLMLLLRNGKRKHKRQSSLFRNQLL